jgi:hypothetical protein
MRQGYIFSDREVSGEDLRLVKPMVADRGLGSTLGDWIDHIRHYGNAGVHPDPFGGILFPPPSKALGITP